MKKKKEIEEPVDIRIGKKDEKVILSFDRDIFYLGMSPVTAIRLAEQMKEKAIEILRGQDDDKTLDDEFYIS